MSYRQAEIYVDDKKAGLLKETDLGYSFEYDSNYLAGENPKAISLTLPVSQVKHESNVLFPFFDGLIPEGWLLDVVVQTWKVNPKDRMGILLVSCQDTIGNVSVRKI